MGKGQGVPAKKFRPVWRPKQPFLWTTAALFLLLLYLPLARHRFVTFIVIQLTFLDALLVGLTAGGTRHKKVAWFLGVTWLLTAALETASLVAGSGFWGDRFQILASASFALFIVLCLAAMLLFILHSKRITTECLFAAASAYLLLAFAFGLFYQAVLVVDPGAFSGLRTPGSDVGGSQIIELIYFSLVTLTTLGYGDISALNPFARMLSGLEAVVGQLYIALLVGWLIGTFVASRMDQNRGAG